MAAWADLSLAHLCLRRKTPKEVCSISPEENTSWPTGPEVGAAVGSILAVALLQQIYPLGLKH